MFRVLIYNFDCDSFWLEEEEEFCSFERALSFAINSGHDYEIFKDYCYISAVRLVARSSYNLWCLNYRQ